MFLLMHNPLSSNEKSKRTTHRYVRFFRRHKIPFKLRSVLKIHNLQRYLDKNKDIEHILFLGGDGSINHLINNIELKTIEPDICLGKSGSGNDFLRSLKKSGEGDITIGEASTDQGPTKFINGCGLGFDAMVSNYVEKDKNKGKMSYFINVFRSVRDYEPTDMEVTVNGTTHHFEDTYFAAVQNGEYFGGGMHVTPDANIESDDFIVCVAHNLNKLLINMLFLTIYPGLHTKLKKYITILKGKTIHIKSPRPLHFQADGEVIENVSEMTVTKKESLRFKAFDKKHIKSLYKNG